VEADRGRGSPKELGQQIALRFDFGQELAASQLAAVKGRIEVQPQLMAELEDPARLGDDEVTEPVVMRSRSAITLGSSGSPAPSTIARICRPLGES